MSHTLPLSTTHLYITSLGVLLNHSIIVSPLNIYLISLGVSFDHDMNVKHNDLLTKYPYKGDEVSGKKGRKILLRT